MKRNILAENMRRFATKNLSEQHLGGFGTRKHTIDIDGMSWQEVHQLLIDVIKGNYDKALRYVEDLEKDWSEENPNGATMLRMYTDSHRYGTTMEPRNGKLNSRLKPIYQRFIDYMTM